MIASMMLQSKISKMKKRLSDQIWYFRINFIAIFILATVITYVLRSTAISGVFGIVKAEIPVKSIPIADRSYHNFKESPSSIITKETPLIIVTPKRFYYGDIEAFTDKFQDVRNKFYIDHANGSPNIKSLLYSMKKWMFQRIEEEDINNKKVVILLPTENIPAPVVIQIISGLKKTPLFNRVVLASGLM